MAQAGDTTTLYGRLNVAVESAHGPASMKRLSNNRSVLGFKGQEDLGDGLKAIWQLEGALSLDTGAGSVTNRNTRIGLAGPLGTLFAGVWTLPYTEATSAFDPFYPTTAGYMALIGNGSASNADNLTDRSAFDRRQQNVVQYWTPALGALHARLAYSFGEGVVPATGATPSLASASLSWDSTDLSIVSAFELHRHYQTATTSDRAGKLGASYQWGPVRLSGLVERLEYRSAEGRLARNAWYVSAVWRNDRTSVVGGYSKAGPGKGPTNARVGSIAAGPHTGATQLTLGAEYSLSRRLVLYGYGSRIQNENNGHYEFAINPLGLERGGRGNVWAAGLRYAF